jgi:hypothetical protein
MTKVAGRVADGILCHSFTTEAYLRERTIPALRAARGNLDGFELSLPVFFVLGDDDDSSAAAEAGVREQIASTASATSSAGSRSTRRARPTRRQWLPVTAALRAASPGSQPRPVR